MPCYRYDPDLKKVVLIPGKKAILRDPAAAAQNLSFTDQIARGYKRQEQKGERINGRARGIKNIWSTPMVPCRTSTVAA